MWNVSSPVWPLAMSANASIMVAATPASAAVPGCGAATATVTWRTVMTQNFDYAPRHWRTRPHASERVPMVRVDQASAFRSHNLPDGAPTTCPPMPSSCGASQHIAADRPSGWSRPAWLQVRASASVQPDDSPEFSAQSPE